MIEFNQYTMITAAIIFGCLIPLVAIIFSPKIEAAKALRKGGGQLKDELDATRAELASARTEIAEMGARLSVLERLVTDDDRSLAEEINRLKQAETAAAQQG